MAIDYVSLGKRIQARRKICNFTQENLAEKISVTVGYISQIERGITKVNLDTLSKIAESLNCELSEFLTGTTKKSSSYLSEDFNKVFSKLNPTNKKIILEISEVVLKNQI